MSGLTSKKYVHIAKKRFDPFALVGSVAGLIIVLTAAQGVESFGQLFDLDSLIIVGVGTASSLLFQFDFGAFFSSMSIVVKSFMGAPEKKLLSVLKLLDQAILTGQSLQDLREGQEISGEILGDIVYMYHQGLVFDEIDEFVTSRIADDYLERKTAVALLNKAAVIAPSLGLFGTVMGLIGVLRALSNPAAIGPSMSLALLTTAYGAAFGSLIFTPLAGRIEHQNAIYIENHRQLLSKISILIKRQDRNMEKKRELSLEVSA